MNKYYSGFEELRTIVIQEIKPDIKIKNKTEAIIKAVEKYRHESTLVRATDMLKKWINSVYKEY